MKVSYRFLVFAGVFGLFIGVIYAYATWRYAGRIEFTGTTLLLVMGMAPLVMAGYLILHGRNQALPEDQPDMTHERAAGEEVGHFSAGSIWPIIMAVGLIVAALGFIFGMWMILLGLVMFTWSTVGLMQESRG